MGQVEIARTEGVKVRGLAIQRGDEVWLTFGARWWELGRWLWWWLTPGLKAWVVVNSKTHGKIRVRTTRVAFSWVGTGATLP